MSRRTLNDTLIYNNPRALWASAALQGRVKVSQVTLNHHLQHVQVWQRPPPLLPLHFLQECPIDLSVAEKSGALSSALRKNSAGILTGSCHGNRRLLPNSAVIAWAGKKKTLHFFFFSFYCKESTYTRKKKNKCWGPEQHPHGRPAM